VVLVARAALVVPEGPGVQAARAAQEDPVALVVQESPVGQVVLGDPVVQAVPGDPVAPVVQESPAVLERDRAAVPLRTRSAIALHRHGRVEVLRAADLAVAVAQTTPEQAATGAARAWAAAA
jgi:hypothetical protein